MPQAGGRIVVTWLGRAEGAGGGKGNEQEGRGVKEIDEAIWVKELL